MNFSLKKTALLSFFSVVVLSSASTSVFALPFDEPTNVIEKQSNDALIIKSNLIQKLAKLEYFTANFNQQVLDAEGNELQNALGTLAVKKPNLVHWKKLRYTKIV